MSGDGKDTTAWGAQVPEGATIHDIKNLAQKAGGMASPPPISPPAPGQLPIQGPPSAHPDQLAGGQFRQTINPAQVPGALQGVGSAFVANQEASTGGKLSPETLAGIEAFQEANQQTASVQDQAHAQEMEKEEKRTELENQVAAEFGALDMPDGDILALREALGSNPFLSAELREFLEKTLQPISIRELITGRAEQVVPIIPGELEFEFQTLKGHEDLLVKAILRESAQELAEYYDDKKALLNLAIGIVRVNDVALPLLEDPAANGKATEATVRARYEALAEMATQVLAMALINFNWFDLRVKNALVPSALKNG